ncbi:MAG: hypothetical protein IPJ94_31325 [Chloroflexi bacterium]|nr:hypothetical protein [Chloroflexota bacterium]
MDYRTENGVTFDYDYDSQPQAVTAVSGGQSFGYDANGNMISRTDLTGAYTQVFDVETG